MTQKLSDNLKQVILEAFETIDAGHDGWLTLDGVREVLQVIGQNPTREDVQAIFALNRTSTVDRDTIADFIEKCVPLKSQSTIQTETAEALTMFDKAENSVDYSISREHFRYVITELGEEPLAEREVQVVLDSLDEEFGNTDTYNISNLARLLGC